MIEMEEEEERIAEVKRRWEGTRIRINKDGSVEESWISQAETEWEEKESENKGQEKSHKQEDRISSRINKVKEWEKVETKEIG